MQSPSTTAKFLKVTYVLFIKGGFLEGKRLQCHVISYSDRGSASKKIYFLIVCSEERWICLGALSLTETCHVQHNICYMEIAHHFSDISKMFRYYWCFSCFLTTPVSGEEFKWPGCIFLFTFKTLFNIMVAEDCE